MCVYGHCMDDRGILDIWGMCVAILWSIGEFWTFYMCVCCHFMVDKRILDIFLCVATYMGDCVCVRPSVGRYRYIHTINYVMEG